MKKFILNFYGGVKTSEVSKESREKWGEWFGSIKESIIDGGNPFADAAMSITKGAVTVIPEDMWPARGYVIISASDMDKAVSIAQNCPILDDVEHHGTVRVYEAVAM